MLNDMCSMLKQLSFKTKHLPVSPCIYIEPRLES